MTTLQERFRGCLLGLACGDAVGTTVEFEPKGSFAPVTDMVGGGCFALPPGYWTDDTSMALCLAESLIKCKGFDAKDQMTRYCNWQQWGYMSSTGSCFDIGMTVATALEQFRTTQNPYAGSTDPRSAGNGSLMRLAPVPLFYFPDVEAMQAQARESSRTTHAAPEALECCELFAAMLYQALKGATKQDVLLAHAYSATEAQVQALARGDYLQKTEDAIFGTGYVISSLEAALWCFHHTDNFADAILKAANLGDDADTTAAITGQIAGAYYGADAIPQRWLQRLCMREDIEHMADQLFELSCHATC
ncbi:ADP-ribosylglycohydrolase family protein [Uliginosibacterium gangwonense]|uniref:ADP-ribosylglycohydrolase family protein n=1 Tax=Uliginosibacterium gangwonense TaxID=392736 RepID=UPI00036221EB|nr:ADP-ribosylglycohydrolase family protein [Uliginosibacterium gangwonense]